MKPAVTGETTQLMTIVPTCSQWTASMPIPTAANPTMAPTIECVVETGQPFWDAMSSHVPAASNAASIPYTSSSGVPASSSASTMPLRMVDVTSPPASTAPRNSNTAATSIACLIVSALEPTEVAIALATSLAPMPQAMNRPNKAARTM